MLENAQTEKTHKCDIFDDFKQCGLRKRTKDEYWIRKRRAGPGPSIPNDSRDHYAHQYSKHYCIFLQMQHDRNATVWGLFLWS